MNKLKIVIICLSVSLIALIVFVSFKLKHKENFQHKIALAQETRKALEHLMVDLRDARESTLLEAPADGQWHHRLAYTNTKQGSFEYKITQKQLFRITRGEALLIADKINDIRIRHQKETPDILEVQVEAQNDTSLISNFKMRIQE